MIITCPSCSTRYKVEPAGFGPEGRRVRCSSCGHVWTATPPEDLPKAIEPEPPAAAPAAEEPAEGRPPPAAAGRRGTGRLGWAALVLAVAVVVGGVVFAREAIVGAWPPAERLYAAVGLAVAQPGEGLRISVSDHNRERDGETVVLVVKGEVTNVSREVRDVPRLKAVLRSADARELASWTFTAAQMRLLPGETAPFVTRIENPSSEAAALNIDFVARRR